MGATGGVPPEGEGNPAEGGYFASLYTNTVLDGSVILFIRYRNHFPVANFKTKHIFGILMVQRKFLKPFGAPQVPQFFSSMPPHLGRPKFFFIVKYGLPNWR